MHEYHPSTTLVETDASPAGVSKLWPGRLAVCDPSSAMCIAHYVGWRGRQGAARDVSSQNHGRSQGTRSSRRGPAHPPAFIDRFNGRSSMALGRTRKRERRAVGLSVDSLEDRVVLSAAVANVEIQYLRAINRLSSQLQAKVEHANAQLTQQAVRIDAQYQSELAKSASQLAGGTADARGAGRGIASLGARPGASRPARRRRGPAGELGHGRFRATRRTCHRQFSRGRARCFGAPIRTSRNSSSRP